jgi:hypothetical protein
MAMDTPTAKWIRDFSRVPFDELGWAAPVNAADPDPLTEEIGVLSAWVEDVTGYYFGAVLPPDMDMRAEVIPARREPEFRKALRMAVEWEAYKQAPDQIEGIIDIEEIQSFTAGSYSETRRGARIGPGIMAIETQVHPWPALNRLLLSIQAPWRSNTREVPAVGWSNPARTPGFDIMNARRRFYDPFDMRPNGPIVGTPEVWVAVDSLVETDYGFIDVPITGLPNG